MRLVLIGADFEENLGIGQIAAAAKGAGHAVHVIPFNEAAQLEGVARKASRARPDVIGLSMQFQHRGAEFIALAARLKALGFKGHLTAGGQYATLAWRDLLTRTASFDSLALFEGEETIVALLDALKRRGALDEVAGLALPQPPRQTRPRALCADLDALPAPLRYRAHSRHFGVPFIPVMASRGCWGQCSFCSITAFYREARRQGGGQTWRQRSPEHVADELAALWRRAGGRAIFCFHDDTLLMPRPKDTLARIDALNEALRARGVDGEGSYAYVGKGRPDNITPELARRLSDAGVIRLYVGVENASARGAAHLNRARQTAHIDTALRACQEADIFVCYNLLLFEPQTQLRDLEENLRFIRAHAQHPINFCRAEPYSGTPLRASIADPSGSFLGWNYRIEDDRAELLFRVVSAAFRQRNFDTDGVANRYMGLGYALKVATTFYPDVEGQRSTLRARIEAVTAAISHETADLLEAALRFVEGVEPRDEEAISRFTVTLGLEIAARDAIQHRALDQAYAAIDAFVEAGRHRAGGRLRAQLKRLAVPVGLGATLAAAACERVDAVDPVPPDGGYQDTTWVVDPPPPDGGLDAWVVDPLPPDGGLDAWVVDPPPPDAGLDAEPDLWLVDPLPIDVGFEDVLVVDPLPPDAGAEDVWVVDPPPPDAATQDMPMVVDPPPPDAAIEDAPRVGDPLPPDAGAEDVWVVDPPPPDAAMQDMPMPVDPPPPDPSPSARLIDQWRDTGSPGVRSADLPLYNPPTLRLTATRQGDAVLIRAAVTQPSSLKWISQEGALEIGEGQAIWRPAHEDDQLRVAARAVGGVAIRAHRAQDLKG